MLKSQKKKSSEYKKIEMLDSQKARNPEGKVKEIIVDSRINKVLIMQTDSVAMLDALDAISEFYGKEGNTLDARRSLRQDLEFQNINLAKKFLLEFEEVRNRVETVENLSKKLETACEKLSKKVSTAGLNMKKFMEKASELETRKQHYNLQAAEIQSFLGRFQLSNKEIETLNSATLDDTHCAKLFFDALNRLRNSYKDCKVMVETHKYSAGFELLEKLGENQDIAYQRLFSWVRLNCENSEDASTPLHDDSDSTLQIAIQYLSDIPAYYSQCQDLVISSRRTKLVQKFILALTHGTNSGQVFRAIDMHAHDPVRYVGDMLAWVHQTVASEMEFLQAMFRPDNNKSKPVLTLKQSAAEEEESSNTRGLSLPDLLSRCLQGLGRPLRSRIMQTLEGRVGLGVLYSLTDLLSFYEETFNIIIPIENTVHSTVKGCLLEAKRSFVSQLNKLSETLLQSPSAYSLDLSITYTSKECAKQLQEILAVYSSALSRLPTDSTDECFIDNVLGGIIQPLLQSCRISAQALQGIDMAIFMLNNVSVIQVRFL